MKNISLVIPSYNNLRHLKNAYESVRKFYKKTELILIDDGSNDGTIEWLESLKDSNLIFWREKNRIGHTVLYDKGINRATNDIVGILHADMYIAPNYIENLVKHLKPGVVVCGTRVEPPLHPPGKEKIVQDFGLDFDSLKIDEFYKFAEQESKDSKDITTKGMFAPWILYKSDFQHIGGHDWGFAPFPYEDSDIFQRWILAGYELIQSRDALVYHLTCRGHRWNDKAGGEVGKNDDLFATFEKSAQRHYIRKWGSWISNDEYQMPIIHPKYDVAFRVTNNNLKLMEALEPWCSVYYGDGHWVQYSHYINQEQPNTKFNMRDRIKPNDPSLHDFNHGVVVEIDGHKINEQDFQILQILSEVLKEGGEVGEFEYGNMKIIINDLTTFEKDLIFITNDNNEKD
jgi:glycosyltransferase involved in cell wall biosynthesis